MYDICDRPFVTPKPLNSGRPKRVVPLRTPRICLPPLIRVCIGCQKPMPGRRRKYCNAACRRKYAYNKWRITNPKGHGCRNTADAGALAELLVCADLLNSGYQVFRAVSPAASCDLIVVISSTKILRIQVKTAFRNRRGNIVCLKEPPERCDVTAAVMLSEKSVTYFPSIK